MAVRRKRRAAKKRRGTKRRRSSRADRARVSGKQRHEVAYLARKHGVTAAAVRGVIKKVGNSRKKVEAALKKM